MENNRSLKSIKREEKRNSIEIQISRIEIESFIKKTRASPNIAYFIRQDISKMTNMEYYKQPKGVRTKLLKPNEIVQQYCHLLIIYGDNQFTKRFIDKMSVQQNQAIRRLSKRSEYQKSRMKLIGPENGIWEHPITIKYIKDKLVDYINHKNMNEIIKFINFISSVNQIFLTTEQDSVVNKRFRDEMPEDWVWDKMDCDIYIRYRLSGLRIEEII